MRRNGQANQLIRDAVGAHLMHDPNALCSSPAVRELELHRVKFTPSFSKYADPCSIRESSNERRQFVRGYLLATYHPSESHNINVEHCESDAGNQNHKANSDS